MPVQSLRLIEPLIMIAVASIRRKEPGLQQQNSNRARTS
jgi:hypothetical protein